MKKILILYGSYGGGHLSAAKSMQNYISENYSNTEIELFDCIEYVNKILNKLTTKVYANIAKNTPKLWGKIYQKSNAGLLSKFSNRANKIMSRKLKNLILSFNPDLIISTHPFSSNMCSYLKKKRRINCKLATIITDFALHNQWINNLDFTDFVFVAHEQMRLDLIKNGTNENIVFSTGIPISPNFSKTYSKNNIYNEFGLSDKFPVCLFFGGGEYGLGKGLTKKVFETLISNFKNIQVIAIAGKNEKLKKDFENIVNTYNANDKVKVLGFTNKVPELMYIANFIVSKPGGLTTSESLASALPIFIVSPLPGQEEDNSRFLEKNKVGYWVKKNDDIYIKLNEFINNLDTMKISAEALGKKNSTRDICEIIFK